ncbi:hypothetical protein CCP3SC15_1260010 [Gammaproteobacteria bacterium]
MNSIRTIYEGLKSRIEHMIYIRLYWEEHTNETRIQPKNFGEMSDIDRLAVLSIFEDAVTHVNPGDSCYIKLSDDTTHKTEVTQQTPNIFPSNMIKRKTKLLSEHDNIINGIALGIITPHSL